MKLLTALLITPAAALLATGCPEPQPCVCNCDCDAVQYGLPPPAFMQIQTHSAQGDDVVEVLDSLDDQPVTVLGPKPEKGPEPEPVKRVGNCPDAAPCFCHCPCDH